MRGPTSRRPPCVSPLRLLLILLTTALVGVLSLFTIKSSPRINAAVHRALRHSRSSAMSSSASKPRILVTGGAGYIGSHTVVELVTAGYPVTIVDNLINSSEEAVRRVKTLVPHPDWIEFVKLDINDRAALHSVMTRDTYGAVIHFAALKAVGESVAKPLEYYHNNIGGLLTLLTVMKEVGVKAVVFSSSATVYGSATPPFSESSPTGTGITNPYGMTKHMAEVILRDFQAANPTYSVALLRYFNPVGAHASGRIGEDPAGIPNNLMPYIQRVATGRLPKLVVHGSDYDTPDGTGLRDYIHVVDLAAGHVKALEWLAGPAASGGIDVFNLGTGKPSSVLEVVAAYAAASGKDIPYELGPRRPGDVARSFALPDKAREVLHWSAAKGLKDMVEDSWRWVSNNPAGYGSGK